MYCTKNGGAGEVGREREEEMPDLKKEGLEGVFIGLDVWCTNILGIYYWVCR